MCNRAYYKKWKHHSGAKYGGHYGHPAKKFWKERFKAALNYPPVNVQEEDDKYILYLYAPGYEKNDFLIATIDNTLKISAEKLENEEQTAWRRQEYSPKGFKRQFELNDKVDLSAITAKYENGVLIVSLPKLEEFETSRQEIQIV